MRILVALICLIALPCHAADKVWLTGKLLENRTSILQTYSAEKGSGGTSNHKVSDIEIDAGDRIYFTRGIANFGWSKVPQVTENAPIQYRIEKDHVFILDDKGKEIKLTLVKVRMKDLPTKP